MAINEVVNAGEISSALWPLVSKALSPFITVLKVVGIVLFIYIVYLIIRGFLTLRRNKRIDITYEKVLEIDKKLDEVLKRTAKKEKIVNSREEKLGFFARLLGFGKKEKKDNKKEKKK